MTKEIHLLYNIIIYLLQVSLNLLEHVLTLFVKVRTFSYAKDIKEKHKVAKKQTKKRSLRTEIKQASSSLELGH